MKEAGGVGITVGDEREREMGRVTGSGAQGRAGVWRRVHREEMQALRQSNVSGRDGKIERWELGWGQLQEGSSAREERRQTGRERAWLRGRESLPSRVWQG